MNQLAEITPTRQAPRLGVLAHFILFATIIVALRWPFAWTSNEETYFILAHRLVDPAAYGPMDAVFDSSRGKWLGLLSFGWPVKWFGFEAAHALLGAFTVVVTAAGLAALARMIRLAPLPAVAALLLFMALGQSIAGNEWFVGAIETKTIAYGLGLIALGAANDGQPRIAGLLVALAGYFHFLVGGFWLFVVALFLAVDPVRRSTLRSFISIALLLLLPLLAVLLVDARDSAGIRPPPGMPDADFIYSVLRAPHHVAPFDGPKPWGLRAVVAGALGLLIAPLCWIAADRTEGPLQPLLRVIGLALLLVPIAVIASWIDRHHGALGKFYLFRPVSPLLLLVLFAFAALAQRLLGNRRWMAFTWAAIALASLASILNSPRVLRWPPRDPEVGPLVAAVRDHTAAGQVVLVDPDLDWPSPYLEGPSASSLARKLGRPMFVSWKFVPTNAADIYRWYGRLEQRKHLFAENCLGDRRIGALILSPQHATSDARCGTLVYADGKVDVLVLRSAPSKADSGMAAP